jgi:hypothetical protein
MARRYQKLRERWRPAAGSKARARMLCRPGMSNNPHANREAWHAWPWRPLRPLRRPREMYIRRCHHYLDNPPPAGWDGVWVLTEK